MLLFIFWPDFEEVAIVTPTQSVSMSFDQLEATLTKNREERERR
ncbi:MAG: hypothetical protein O7A04_06765 [Acidobacteria bacterium]|nr:hypothetical protein [Acidobacteriota bacterium]